MWKSITVIGIMLSLFFGTMTNSAINTLNNLVAVAEEHSAQLNDVVSMTEEPTKFTAAKAVVSAE